MVSAADSERDEHQEAFSRQGPLPDLLPQNEHPSWPSPHHRGARGEALQELEVRRVATQLRVIGDEFNATVLRRHAAPHWRDWRDACRGLFNFITQTLSTLYRLV
uniref:BCL2 binding component 3 n=1 Tax=Anabas testudineus TaxID=64144 RepID=A0A3Q1HIL4_ANATE